MTTLIDIRPALRGLLLADAGLTAIVGTRVFPMQLPQGSPVPAVVYNEVSNVGDYNTQRSTGLARPRYQVDGWAADPDSAWALGLSIREAIDGYKGIAPGSGGDAVLIRGIFMDNSRSIYDEVAKLFGSSNDFIIWFAEW